jgi:hypothetical protein
MITPDQHVYIVTNFADNSMLGNELKGAGREYIYKRYWRRTRSKSMDEPIGICRTCRQIVEPVEKQRDEKGTHGINVYRHPHRLVFLMLGRSGEGTRYYNLGGDIKYELDEHLKAILTTAGEHWRELHDPLEAVVDYVRRKLSELG